MAFKFVFLAALVAVASASHSHLHEYSAPLAYARPLAYSAPLVRNVVEKVGVRYTAPQVLAESYTPAQTYTIPTTKVFREDPDVHELETHIETSPSYSKRITSHPAPIVHETVSAPIIHKTYEPAPVVERLVEHQTYVAPVAPIVHEHIPAPIVHEAYAAPVAPIVHEHLPAPIVHESYAAPLVHETLAAPLAYSAPVAPVLPHETYGVPSLGYSSW